MLKKISFVAAGNMINALLGFLYLWAIANSLPLGEFGKYSFLISLIVVLGRLTDFGTNSIFVTQSILEKHKKGEFLGVKSALFLVAVILDIVLLRIFGLLTISLAIISLLSILAYTFNYILYAFYQKEEKFTYLILLYTIPGIVKALAAGLIVANVLPATLSLSVGIFGLSIFTGGLLLIFHNPLRDLDLHWNLVILKKAWPAGTSQIITEAWPSITNAIAKLIQGFENVGIFSLANKVSVVFSLLSLSIFSVLLPKNARRKKQELKYSLDETFLLAGLLLVIGLIGVISSRFVISRFFGPQFERSLELLNILVFAAAFNSIAAFMENYFFIQEDTGKILVINTTKIVAFLIGGAILIPSFSLKGLAYAQLTAGIAATVATVYYIFTPKKESFLRKLLQLHS